MTKGSDPVRSGIDAGLTLEALVVAAASVSGVRRDEVRPGDLLVVETRNSSYSIDVLDRGEFVVSGGWFERHVGNRAVVGIAGCTCGGNAILTEMLAAPGLFLEFGNGVRTTRIRSARIAGRRSAHLFN